MFDREASEKAKYISAKVSETMYGIKDVIELCLVAIFTKGHVLLEGNPGLGKTALVKTLGEVARLHWGRIQFTPDLMPADITGTEMPADDGRLEFRPGPIFKSLILADEINRASPKTQSAMLEAMAERQVTVLGETHKLSNFFTVLATQNPIEHEGVYPLPAAQSDRFMFKISLNPPNRDILSSIVEKDTGKEVPFVSSTPMSIEEDNKTQAELDRYYRMIRSRKVHPAVNLHIQNMVLASNQRSNSFGRNELDRRFSGLNGHQLNWLGKHIPLFQFGLGPRAATAATLAAKAWSLLFSADNHDNATVIDLANVVIPSLRHRIKLDYDWESQFEGDSSFGQVKERDSQQKIDWFLAGFVHNTAPQQDGYANLLKEQLP